MDNTLIVIKVHGMTTEEAVHLHNEMRECLIKQIDKRKQQTYDIETQHERRTVRTSVG